MATYMRDERELDTTASRTFTRLFLLAFLTAGAVGLVAGLLWIAAGLIHFHLPW